MAGELMAGAGVLPKPPPITDELENGSCDKLAVALTAKRMSSYTHCRGENSILSGHDGPRVSGTCYCEF